MGTSSTRRGFLAGMTAVAVVGFDPIQRSWVSTAEAASGPLAKLPHLDGELTTDPAERAEVSSDFGRIVTRTPVAVLRPGSVNDIVKMVKYARNHGLKVAARGQGHSTQGQTLVQGGIVIDTSTLATIHSVGPAGADVDAGVVWRDLISATVAVGYTPTTTTSFIGLSVGGTLSNAGVGGEEPRYGMQIDNVLELEVVTGLGLLEKCSPTKNAALFNAVLGGLGQFAIIVRARIRLVPAAPLARFYQAVYPDLHTFLVDLKKITLDERFNHVEATFAPGPDDTWIPVLFATKYFSPASPPDDAALTAGLQFIPPTLQIADLPYIAFMNRLDPIVQQLKDSGDWYRSHPWFDVFLPSSTAEAYIASVLAELPPSQIGGGSIQFYGLRRSRLQRPFFRAPNEEVFFLFDILRVSDAAAAPALVDANVDLYERARAIGGTRYCIGSIPFDQGDWKQHFGVTWPAFVLAKFSFDPLNTLTPGHKIFTY